MSSRGSGLALLVLGQLAPSAASAHLAVGDRLELTTATKSPPGLGRCPRPAQAERKGWPPWRLEPLPEGALAKQAAMAEVSDGLHHQVNRVC